MDNELRERIKQIENENIVFGIFIFLIILSYIANKREINYFVNGSEEDKVTYYYIIVFVFVIVVIINIYYVYVSYKEVISLREQGYSKRKKYAELNLIASLVALVASSILLYIAVTDTELDAEVSL